MFRHCSLGHNQVRLYETKEKIKVHTKIFNSVSPGAQPSLSVPYQTQTLHITISTYTYLSS